MNRGFVVVSIELEQWLRMHGQYTSTLFHWTSEKLTKLGRPFARWLMGASSRPPFPRGPADDGEVVGVIAANLDVDSAAVRLLVAYPDAVGRVPGEQPFVFLVHPDEVTAYLAYEADMSGYSGGCGGMYL